MKKTWTVADSVTVIRIIGTLCLIFLQPLSAVFYVFYTISGLSDALDGFIARKTGTSGDFGAKLDSSADLLFYSVMIIKIMPFLIKILSRYVWYIAFAALFLRLAAYATAAVKYRKFSAMHTYMNKLTGMAVFLIPYALQLPFAVLYCKIAACIGVIASLEELMIHVIRPSYNADIKFIFMMKEKEPQ